jgi:hypothetical protein
MGARLALALLACGASLAAALESPTWPPPAATEARMRELQQVLASRDSTAPQREAAREELSGLLKSPAGQVRGRTADERPARAAIDPFPSVVKPTPAPLVPAPGVARIDGPGVARIEAPGVARVDVPGVARVEVIDPPRPAVNPRTGAVPAPSGRFAVDPRTGSVLHETPSGYIDPRTGQFSPR